MFGAFKKFGKLGALASSVARAWSPLALWPDGVDSPGMWSSPSTLPASFNDYTGTTPVATPGSVADSANPVGLALDIRAGAPDTLGPELITGTPSWVQANWTDNGGRSYSSDGSGYLQFVGATAGAHYEVTFDIADYVAGAFCVNIKTAWDATPSAAGSYSYIIVGATGISLYASGLTATINNLSVREIPGNHMLQSTSAARPLESARVNLLQYTEDFSNVVWLRGETTILSNTGVAPDGTTTADTIIANATTGEHRCYQTSAGKGHADGVFSAYVKAKEYGFAFIGLTESNATIYRGALVDLSTGAVVSNSANAVEVVDIGSGWYRVSVAETSVDFDFYGLVAPVPSAGTTIGSLGPLFTGDGTSGIYAWGAQMEFGSTATPYQAILTDGSTYTATGITPFQLYDGTDDGMATASFAAGTLVNGMDCLIAVRRDSAANAVCGLYESVAEANKVFGIAESASGSGCVGSGAGTPTVWVDGVQLSGGTAVTRGTLHTALTVGDWHILEFRGLDLSTWTAAGFGLYTSYVFPGPRGDIMLFPSTASTEDKDAARQWLADYYGVTLP